MVARVPVSLLFSDILVVIYRIKENILIVQNICNLGNSKKDFGISDKGYTRSWQKVRKEIDKCVLICANCHRESHIGIKQLPRVTEVEKRGELREA
jgi:hypothetical protein